MASDQTVVFFCRPGYEYRYRIHTDSELLLSYHRHIRPRSRGALTDRRLIFEVRTNFISKPRAVDDVIGSITEESERFAYLLPYLHDLIGVVLLGMAWLRLSEYWLPEESIRRLGEEALGFVNRAAYDPQYDSMAVIPVVLEIDVCTVQLQGELFDATIRRSIKPDCLLPVGLWGGNVIVVPGDEEKKKQAMSRFLRGHLMRLPRERVEDVSIASARMESCPICWEAPAYGTRLTPLPCGHVFHYHCIVRWLMNTKACPVCRFEIVIIEPKILTALLY